MGVVHKSKRNSILLGQDNNALTWLIIINATIFILLNFIKIIYMVSDTSMVAFQVQILDWAVLPGQPANLAEKPWTLFTYMFTHIEVWPMIGTTLWLWWFGYILQDLSGNSRLAPVYLYSGLAGAFAFVLATFFIPQLSNSTPAGTSALIGGGASVMGVAIATTALAPGYRVFPMLNGGIPLWIITLVFVAIDFSTIGSTSGNYAVAHLAGGLMGYLFVVQLGRGYDMGAWMMRFSNWVNDLFNPEKKYKQAPLRKNHFYKATKKPFEKTARVTEQKIDELLDKISKEGYHSLTDEEKEMLKKASNEGY